MNTQHGSRRAFSLVELVIVVVILGIIGAIAIPRMSRGAEGAADSGLRSDLAIMRSAIELYSAEHGGDFPTFAALTLQLTTYSDDLGGTNNAKTNVFIYGPYLRAIPELKVGTNKGSKVVVAVAGGAAGWLYDEFAGTIVANLAIGEVDVKNVPYNTY